MSTEAVSSDGLELAVVGAHLSGQPLNHQLVDLGAELVATTRTAPRYRLFDLGTTLPKPGLVRVSEQGEGASIEVEVWRLAPASFGIFVDALATPMAIGHLELADGGWVSGFVVEPYALEGAREITAFGGWRAYLDSGGASIAG